MLFCYVDEAGCTGMLPSSTSQIQPVFVLAAVVFDQAGTQELTREFIYLKRRFFPNLPTQGGQYLSHILAEVKGAEIRRKAVACSRRERRHARGFLDNVIRLLEARQAKVFGRIWIKGIGTPFNGRSVYTSSMQAICLTFQHQLTSANEQGMVIADSRNKVKNATVSHSIFTQKYKAVGDEYGRVLEMPVFGHSENHAGIQVADLLCSALLFPIATSTYCLGHVSSVHVQASYRDLKLRYGSRLKQLQFRFWDETRGRWRGGYTVSDAIGQRSSSSLFS